MKNQNLTIPEQAELYVDQVGKSEAMNSHFYINAQICECGECFNCLVKKFADSAVLDWAKFSELEKELSNSDYEKNTDTLPVLIKI